MYAAEVVQVYLNIVPSVYAAEVVQLLISTCQLWLQSAFQSSGLEDRKTNLDKYKLVDDDGAACLRAPVTDAVSGPPARAADGGAEGPEKASTWATTSSSSTASSGKARRH